MACALYLPMQNKILILDFGSQYTQLIARRVREMEVYCEVLPFHSEISISADIKGIILAGSPRSVREENPLMPATNWFASGLPILGICYGAQLMAFQMGGEVAPGETREYGRAQLRILQQNPLLNLVSTDSAVWMSHSDTITRIPEGFDSLASTASIPVAAMAHREKPWFGLQFHPEVVHSEQGMQVLKNFVFDICACEVNWTPGNFIEESVRQIQEQTRGSKVILGLSGGVDSSVAAMLLHRAIGDKLHCIFVDQACCGKMSLKAS